MSKLAKLSLEEIKTGLGVLAKSGHTWSLKGAELNNPYLYKQFKFKTFEDTWAFLTKVSMRSHRNGHHPKITTVYNVVELELTTHDVGGVSKMDLELAGRFSTYAK